jgi:MFS transporter, DHA2 family, methylenomycin A resistance protein
MPKDGRMETIEQQRTGARPASRLALVVICLGYFMVIVDTTVVNVALPAIGRELRASFLPGLRIGLVIAAGAFLAGAVVARRGVE